MTEKLPDNLEEALEFIREQQVEISHLQSENSELKATLDKQNIMLLNLNEMLVKSRKAMYGKSSEQLGNIEGSEQLSLFNEAEVESSAKAEEPTVETVNVKSHSRRKILSREELPESVEHKKFIIDLDDKKVFRMRRKNGLQRRRICPQRAEYYSRADFRNRLLSEEI